MLAGVWAWASAGCGGAPIGVKAEPDSHASSTGQDASTSSIVGTTAVTSTSASTTGIADDTRGTTTNVDPTEVIFLIEPDGGGPAFECDTFEQDCPKGEKCTVWANDGGNSWNATKCVPVVDDPAGLGEPCHVEISGTSGIDDCGHGALCWDVDPRTLEGYCIGFCLGSESNPECEDPNAFCTSSGALGFCRPRCNPVAQDCPPGQGCYLIANEWGCAPDASGDAGAYGDPCEFINVCDPGLMCLDASTVPPGLPCEGAGGCCTEVCDITDPAGDLQCGGAVGGQVCVPWYADGTALPIYENVGVCTLPA